MSPVNSGISAKALNMTRTPPGENKGRTDFRWSTPAHPQHFQVEVEKQETVSKPIQLEL